MRFSEFSFYDPWNDCEAVKMMATTGLGTWSAVCPTDDPRALREHRQEFKDYVIEAMQRGDLPEELDFES